MPKPPEVKAVAKRTVEVTIVLSERAASWLRNAVQNPLTPEEEAGDDYALRCELFTQLTQALKGPDAQANSTNADS